MVVTWKHDSTPSRTVDLSILNKFCHHKTFATASPFQLMRQIPKETWNTVMDVWNGYHSVLTTFITPFSHCRYTRALQGFLSSGDGYNCRCPFSRRNGVLTTPSTMTRTWNNTGGGPLTSWPSSVDPLLYLTWQNFNSLRGQLTLRFSGYLTLPFNHFNS